MVAQPTPSANLPKRGDFRILWLPAVFCLLLIAFEVHLLLNDRYFTRARSSVQGESIAKYVSGKHRVRKKTAGTLVWDSPEAQSPLFREDAIATMDDSEAVITFADQSVLVVEPNSLVILEQAPESKPGAPSAGIIARLVKGSVKRRNSGTSPFFIKLSRAKEAEPIEFSDTSGHSVFRVIYKIEGYDVVVESGAVKVQGKTVTPSPKLKAPKLNRPKIEMVPAPKSSSRSTPIPSSTKVAWLRWWSQVVPSAMAADARQIAIHFSWEGIEGASSYRVQVSRDSSFTTVLSEGEVIGTTFEFLFPAPEQKSELYFRVAGVTLAREVGEYSSVEKIEVNPVTPEAPATVQAVQAPVLPTPPPVQPRSVKIVRPGTDAKSVAAARATAPVAPSAAPPAAVPAPEPKESEVALPSPPVPAEAKSTSVAIRAQSEPKESAPAASVATFAPPSPAVPLHFWAAFGALYDHRQFKNESAQLREATGGGFVPAQLAIELRRSADNRAFYSLGGSTVFESARPELPAPGDSALSVGSFRAWLTYGRSFGESGAFRLWQVGPYLATSRRISSQGLVFRSESLLLAGGMIALQNDPVTALAGTDIAWRVQAALLGIGAFGLDAELSARRAILRWGASDGLFAGIQLGARRSGVESELGLALQLGWFQ